MSPIKEKYEAWLQLIKLREEKEKEEKERRKAKKEKTSKQFEGSSLTEEHEVAAVLSPSSYDSTANTSNKKRKSHTTSKSSSSNIAFAPTKTSSRHRMELEYKNLLQNLSFPPQLHVLDEEDDDDSDWLCKDIRPEEKRRRYESDGSVSRVACSRSSTAWCPRARYLHQIDAFALPYVVPL